MFYKASTSAQTPQKRAVILHKKEKVVSRHAHGSHESQTTSLRANLCTYAALVSSVLFSIILRRFVTVASFNEKKGKL